MHERDLDAPLKPRPAHPSNVRTLGDAGIGQRVVLACGSVVEVTRQTGEGEWAATWVRHPGHAGRRCCPHPLAASMKARAEDS